MMRKNIDDFAWFWLLAYQAITPSQEVPHRLNRILAQDLQNLAYYHRRHLPSHPSASSSERKSTASVLWHYLYIVTMVESVTISMYMALETDNMKIILNINHDSHAPMYLTVHWHTVLLVRMIFQFILFGGSPYVTKFHAIVAFHMQPFWSLNIIYHVMLKKYLWTIIHKFHIIFNIVYM